VALRSALLAALGILEPRPVPVRARRVLVRVGEWLPIQTHERPNPDDAVTSAFAEITANASFVAWFTRSSAPA
jgi:hypothetical protein